MNDTNTVSIKHFIPYERFDDPQYRQWAYDDLKHQISHQLFDILEQCKNPAVVELSQLHRRPRGVGEEISIDIKITPVRYRDVEILRASNTPYIAIPKRLSFLDKLRWLFRREES